MKSISRIILSIAVAVCSVLAVSCTEKGGVEGSSTDAYFFQENFACNLTLNPVINIPVVRLGTKGDLKVSITSNAPSYFKVPSEVTIKDGDKLANIEVEFGLEGLTKNEVYTIDVNISSFSSEFGYGSSTVTIEYPTSYFEYGNGIIYEGWWGEQEEKTLYVRDYAYNVYQCYLPGCWGHDSGPGYDVKDYMFYWNTETNQLYVPVQFMGTDDWCIADRGTISCRFGGPDYKEGSWDWMLSSDEFYYNSGFEHPHFDPNTNTFYLSDSAAISPVTGEVVYGTPGSFDKFVLN